MKLGIAGLKQSGKKTVFEALTQNIIDPSQTGEDRIEIIKLPDIRIDILSKMYKPKKTIYTKVEYLLSGTGQKKKSENTWGSARDCDAIIHIIRNFNIYGADAPTLYNDFQATDQDMILSDLVIAEKRLERLELDKKRGKKINAEEFSLIKKTIGALENEIPLRKIPEIITNPLLRGFAFISAKPTLVLFNNEEDDDLHPVLKEKDIKEESAIIRGKLEQELSQMDEDEAKEFLADFNIKDSAMDRVIKKSYEILGLISFFTVGEDEVRAWTIKKDTMAVDAAEVIHSDIKKGFIRAEVVSYDDLINAGNFNQAKKNGTVRVEGKNYIVQDGDILNFRFNV